MASLSLAEEERMVDRCIKEYLNFQKLQAAHLCVSAPLWASVNSRLIDTSRLVFIAVLHAGSIR